MRNAVLYLLSATFFFFTAGCSEDVDPQAGFVGLWKLETRKLPDGEAIQPPQFSGLIEWFKMDDRRGHVTFALSSGEKDLQFQGAIYTITRGAFTREIYLQMGDGYMQASQPAVPSASQTDQVQIAVDGAKTRLTYADGATMIFEGDSCTVTHKDGTVDTWKKAG